MSSGTRHRLFDRGRLRLRPLAERASDLDLSVVATPAAPADIDPAFSAVAADLAAARASGAARVLMMGAHVLRAGMQRYLIDLMEQGFVDCLAVNGACLIHDYEFALTGATTESVARYIGEGQFGLWNETGGLNTIAARAAREGLGLGEAVGRAIAEGGFPHADVSVLAAAWRLGVPVTAHVGIGYDIVHEHPDCDGAAWGQTSYTDFLIFAGVLEALEGGVVMTFGSAVMAPEIFLKALAMVRNAAAGPGPSRFTSLVCDLAGLPPDTGKEAGKDAALYYFRPWKTLLVRTVAGGGRSHYVRGHHAQTIPQLWAAVCGTGRD